MQNLSQIRNQILHLSHVQAEYSSSLLSYQTTTKLMSLISQNLKQEIKSRIQQTKSFTTPQGKGLRMIMLGHYKSLQQNINKELLKLNEVLFQIQTKHTSMKNSLKFVDPLLNQLELKYSVLDKQLAYIKQKIEKADKMKIQLFGRYKSQIQPTEKQITEEKNKENSISYKYKYLKNKNQIQQVQEFLQLKLEEIQNFISIEKQLARKIIQKIFKIFQQTLGKGLEKTQSILLTKIKTPQSFYKNLYISKDQQQKMSQSEEHHPSQSNQNSLSDLKCYENLDQIISSRPILNKFAQIKKKLYENQHFQGVDITQSIQQERQSEGQRPSQSKPSWKEIDQQISPTFNQIPPLIFQQQEQKKEKIISSFELFIPPGFQFQVQQLIIKQNNHQKLMICQNSQKQNANIMNL